jgi:hypothetical protein
MAYDRDGYLIPDTWIICPDCGVGPGGDHKNGCQRDKKRHALFHLDPNIDYAAHTDPRMRLTIRDFVSK